MDISKVIAALRKEPGFSQNVGKKDGRASAILGIVLLALMFWMRG